MKHNSAKEASIYKDDTFFQETLKVEKRINNFVRGLIAIVAFAYITAAASTSPTITIIVGYSVSLALAIHFLVIFLLLRSKKLTFARLKHIQYFSVAIDITLISLGLWFSGNAVPERTLKSPVFILYPVFIALAATRYSLTLITFASILSIVNYVGMFILSVAINRITLGTITQSYLGPEISTITIIIQTIGLLFISFVLRVVGRGYRQIMTRVVSSQRRADQQAQQAKNMRDAFGRYFSKEVADRIINNAQIFEGVSQTATVMFCDFRNFTEITESISSVGVVKLLNKYFSQMVDIVFAYGGTLDKYTGDGFMAVFGVPIRKHDDVCRAIIAAWEINKCVHRINAQSPSGVHLSLGIGINTGEVIAGNIGSHKRIDYTVIGRTVNLASRLEGANKRLGTDVLLSASTEEALQEARHKNIISKEDVITEYQGTFRIRGIKDGIKVYSLKEVRAQVQQTS